MNGSLLRSRALYVLLVLMHGATMFAAGALLAILFASPEVDAARRSQLLVLNAITLVVVRAFVLAQLPMIVRNCHWQVLRPLVMWELAGVTGVWTGAVLNPGLLVGWPLFTITAALMCPLAMAAARGGANPLPERPDRFFLFSRANLANWSARRHLAGGTALAFLTAALLTLIVRQSSADHAPVFDGVQTFAIAVAVGLVLNLPQRSSPRSLGVVGPGFLLVAIAALAHAISPVALWPAAVVGVGAGLAMAGFGTCFLLHVMARHRFAALLLADAGAALAALAGMELAGNLAETTANWLCFVLVAAAFGLFLKLYFREFAELVYEIVFIPMYRFDVRGPGQYMMPTRGPTLTIGNHAAYFDPLFLIKVLPVSRVRAMMISTFLDRPFLKWLAGEVYEAIRVPDGVSFRREAPELDEVIAALKRGEHAMIFPEAWLRRKEEQPIRRFAQGVWRVLHAVPDTVVVPCWIETSWGSYLSYKNGPPTKNKKFDWWYTIQYAAGEPVIVPPEILKDHIATRRYLMELVLDARRYLGLPPHPLPGFTAQEDEKGEGKEDAAE